MSVVKVGMYGEGGGGEESNFCLENDVLEFVSLLRLGLSLSVGA